MESKEFVIKCIDLKIGESATFPTLDFPSIFWLKSSHNWYNFEVYAYCNRDLEMKVWNQKHPYEENCTTHICPKGTKLRVWMISRFGDVGVTDNLVNPIGYDTRGIEETELYNWEIIRKYKGVGHIFV